MKTPIGGYGLFAVTIAGPYGFVLICWFALMRGSPLSRPTPSIWAWLSTIAAVVTLALFG